MASIGGVTDLGEARRAGSHVGRDEDAATGAGVTGDRGATIEDHEALRPRGCRIAERIRRALLDGDGGDDRERRRRAGEPFDERRHVLARARHLDRHARRGVLDRAGESEPRGEPPHERTKSDPLHPSRDRDAATHVHPGVAPVARP